MKTSSRIMIVLSALLLVPAFFLPLWSIGLWAPQYSEGLGMFIGLTDIWGHGRHDIQNINILNHYIGMQPIEPERVNVLSIMPWVVGGLIVTALATAAAGRRALAGVWVVAFVVLGAAGLYEFYSWNHDYGTNLSPDAPIKIPGMTYQPPVFGTSQLLNIRASSYPSWGTLFITLSLLGGVFVTLREYRRPRKSGLERSAAGRPESGAGGEASNPAPGVAADAGTLRSGGVSTLPGAGLGASVGLLVVLGLAGCETSDARASSETDREVAGTEVALAGLTCDYCGGEIPKARFGGEIVTRSGERYRFMSVECMAGFILDGELSERDIRTLRTVDFNHGSRLIDARTAQYLHSPNRPSPNGMDLVAVDDPKIAWNLRFFFHGELLDWEEVLALVAGEWELADSGRTR